MPGPNRHKGKPLAQLAAEMNDRQRQVIEFKITHRGTSNHEVADALGISYTQAQRIMGSEPVQRALATVTNSLITKITNGLRSAAVDATAALRSIVRNKKANDSDRVAASRVIFATLKDLGEFEVPDDIPDDDAPRSRGFTLEGCEDALTGAPSN